jgi:hypothetical protein
MSLGFFISQPHPRALIHGLKPFRIWLRIRRANRFGGVNEPAEIFELFHNVVRKFLVVSAGPMAQLKSFWRGQ